MKFEELNKMLENAEQQAYDKVFSDLPNFEVANLLECLADDDPLCLSTNVKTILYMAATRIRDLPPITA